MIRVITFDLWNTIFKDKSYSNRRFSFFTKFLDERNIRYSLERVKNIYERNFTSLDYNPEDNDFHHINNEVRISNLLNILKFKINDSDRILIKEEMEKEMLKDPPLLKKGVKATLEALSPNYKIGLISNTGITPGYVIIEVLKNYNIYSYFQKIIFSDEIGFYKPHPSLFTIVLKEFNCKSENAIHIGDQLQTDIKGAKTVGMLTVWINDANHPKFLKIQPDYEINEIFEVVKIIQNLT